MAAIAATPTGRGRLALVRASSILELLVDKLG
jgi:hypothetical protein